MSYRETTEDLGTLVGKLANLMTDNFKCCISNYEALVPYIGKKETNSKVRYKLVCVNILLNKLNQELLGLRVEYVNVLPYEQKMQTVLSEGGRKRKMSDVLVLGRHETKSMKMGVPFPSSTQSSNALTLETGINIQSNNLVLNDTEETRHSQLQTLDMHNVINIKTEIEDSKEAEDVHEFPVSKSQITVGQDSYNDINNGMTVHFAGDEVNASVSDRFVGGNAYDKSADSITQRENNEMSVPVQSVKSEITNQVQYEDNNNVHSKDGDIYRGLRGKIGCTNSFSYTTKRLFNCKESSVTSIACENESAMPVKDRANNGSKAERRVPHSPIRYEKGDVPVQRANKQSSVDDTLYGIIKTKNGMYRCTLCNRKLVCDLAVVGHVRGKQHKTAQITAKKNGCRKKTEVRNNKLQTLDKHNVKNIETGIQDSNEAEDMHEPPVNDSQIPVAQKSCNDVNNGMTIHFTGDAVNASVAYRFVGGNAYDKSADTIVQRENNGVSVPVQSVKSETTNQVKCEVSDYVKSADTIAQRENNGVSVPIQSVKSETTKQVKCEVSDNVKSADTIAQRENNGVSVPVQSVKSETTKQVKCEVSDNVKSAETITQRENNGVSVPIQSVKSETTNKVKCEDSDNVLGEDNDIYVGLRVEIDSTTSLSYTAKRLFNSKESSATFAASEKESAMLVEERANSCNKAERVPHSPIRYEKGDVPVEGEEKQSCADDMLYGIIKIKNGMYRCTLCNRKLFGDVAVFGHVRGKQHIKARITAKKDGCCKKPEVPNKRHESKLVSYQAVKGHVKGKKHKMKQKLARKTYSEKFEIPSNSRASVPVCSTVAYSLADTVPSNSCDSTASVSACSAVPCSLADTVTIVEHRYQALLTKHSIKLDSIWTYFPAPLHINKNYIRFPSGKLICYLCCEEVGRNIISVRKHISGLRHVDRINILQNMELENKSSSKKLLDIPGSLKNIVPTTQFSLSENGFFCNVCKCFCEDTVVLSHMTGESHRKILAQMNKISTELTTVTM